MKTTTIHIRNMCCQRCVEAVTDELRTLGLNLKSVKLGEAVFIESKKITADAIAARLKQRGFELIKSAEEEISEKIKIAIHEIFTRLAKNDLTDFKLAAYLEEKINAHL